MIKSAPGRTALYLGLVVAGLMILFWLRYVILLAFLALLLAILLDVIADWIHLPRPIAIILAACLVIVVFAGTVALLTVPLLREGTAFLHTLKEKSSSAIEKIEQWKTEYPGLDQFLPNIDSSSPEKKDATTVSGAARQAFVTLSNLLNAGADALAVFFLSIFLAWNPDRWLRGVAQLGPRESVDDRKGLYCRIGGALRSYLFTYGIYIVAMGTLWAVGLWLIGIDYFLIFGILGGVVEVAPYIGPFIGLIPPLAMTLATAPAKALYVLALYIVLHIVEGYLLVPWMMHDREHLPAPIILLSLMACGTLFGALGVLLAVPIGTTAYVIANETIYARRKP
jgi:predicted PurR-regulated permease PerM